MYTEYHLVPQIQDGLRTLYQGGLPHGVKERPVCQYRVICTVCIRERATCSHYLAMPGGYICITALLSKP